MHQFDLKLINFVQHELVFSAFIYYQLFNNFVGETLILYQL